MKRALAVSVPLVVVAGLAGVVGLAGCYQQTNSRPVPVAIVNDACGGNGRAATCAAAAGCEWRALASDCPAGAACPDGVCVTPDPCAALADSTACAADARCAWTGLRASSPAIDLCPVGQSCDAGGYCHTRDASGGGCTCVQPIVCPANADCPAVQCDCSNPAPGNGGGRGTCTCDCPACAPGEACAPCACTCSAGGSCGSAAISGGSAAGGTCTCACPTCAPGATCPPCDCACGAGNVSVSNPPSTKVGAEAPADPCARHVDAAACVADTAAACSWIELGIICVTAPCASGACVQVKPVAGGGGCGCACAPCAAGQSCPPCACTCCGQGAGAGPVPVPT